jgi:hypothetical protein
MARLLIHVEGQTEEAFVNSLLSDHLTAAGYRDVRVRLAGNPRKQRGGVGSWQGVKRDVLRHLKEDRSAIHAIIVDFYGMPNDWPGRNQAHATSSSSAKAECVETALLHETTESMGGGFDPRRFVPLVMMHEFEALLFSDPSGFARGIARSDLAPEFRAIREAFANPEDINDSAETAPSKRILRVFPGYQKSLFGVLASLEIGLPSIRRECTHFSTWLGQLEALCGVAPFDL